MTLGLFIGRLNPPHIGHINTIQKALNENEKVIVLLGTPIQKDDNNPLDFLERKKLLNKVFLDSENIEFIELMDNESDLIWIYDIHRILYEKGNNIKDVNFYGGDFKNDSAYISLKKYENNLLNNKINYIENSRDESFIEHCGKDYEISATNLRKALREKDYKLSKKFCDIRIFKEIIELFK